MPSCPALRELRNHKVNPMSIEELKKRRDVALRTRDAIKAPGEDEAALLAEIREAEEETRARRAAAREREEDARFAEYQAKATAPVRLGEARFEPGQAIFRQIDLTTKRVIETKPEDQRGPLIEAEFRAAVVYPAASDLAKWELEYPNIVADIMMAWGDHNRSVRRDRLGK